MIPEIDTHTVVENGARCQVVFVGTEDGLGRDGWWGGRYRGGW